MSDLTDTNSMINEIRELLLNARQRVTVQVNTELLSTYWNIGKIIVEYEQENKERADYGKQTLKQLSKDLTEEFGKGFSRSNLQNMRAFYLAYPICQTLSGKLDMQDKTLSYSASLNVKIPFQILLSIFSKAPLKSAFHNLPCLYFPVHAQQ